MNRRAVVIVNPVARGIPAPEKLEMAVAWLESRGWQTSVEQTRGPDDATALASEASDKGVEVVVACGGDGTVNEAVNGLAGSETALAVLPGGTANVWAKEVGISREPLTAIRLICDGRRRRIDLGVVEGDQAQRRHFLLMAGVGLDGYVVKRVPEGLKRRLGAASYVMYALRESLRYHPEKTSLLIDGEAVEGELLWLLAANTRSYGGVISVAREAEADDGLLDVYAFEGRGMRQMAGHALRILRRNYGGARNIVYRRAESVEIRSGGFLDCQVDGEVLGFAPRVIRVERSSLAVILPTKSSPLFSRDE